jgi:FMN-dependent oxidoreductase (nitrilotriacetate monooxygenase family)
MPARNPRHLHLNAFLNAVGHHDGAWRHPDSSGHRLLDVEYHIELARIAERGLLDSVFLGDGLCLGGHPATTVAGGLEPLTLLSAIATATEHIGLVATASTTFYEPYLLARALASLDHVSHGRAGWHLTTSDSLAEAANFHLDEPVEHAVNHERAAEFLDVATQLWDSWADDAVVHDRRAGRYADPERIRDVEHTGLFFKVRGPLNVQRTPQGWPLLAFSTESADGPDGPDGLEFAARYAEVVFAEHLNVGDAVEFALEVKSRATGYGREADTPVVLQTIAPVIGSTEGEARRLARELTALGATTHRLVVGTPEQIADTMQEWAGAGAADGFTVAPPLLPSGLAAFVDQVVPILRRRGLFRSEYDLGTLRERFGLPRPEDHFPEPSTARSLATLANT